MKKTLLFALLGILLVFTACNNNNKHSKAYNESKAIMDKVVELANKATNCDDLDMAAFSIYGILGVEGVDAISADEQASLSEQMDKLTELMEQKRMEFNCVEEMDDLLEDDMPSDTPYEEEAE